MIVCDFNIVAYDELTMYRVFHYRNSRPSSSHSTAGRMIKTGLTASVIVSQWTWAATLLQSSNVAWQYGVSGPFWYASGATIQVLLFGVLAINLKKVAPSAHTVCEIVKARWGKTAHLTFLFFCFAANLIVTSMLLLGGAATVEALTGMDYRLAAFLIPWGVILYTASGGLQATFLASYIHTVIIFAVLILMVFIVYVKVYSSDQIFDYLAATVSYTEEECQQIYSTDNSVESTFYDAATYACGQVTGNRDGSYLTMLSSQGLMFGIINIVGNFGTVFVDQSYWQSAIAARPESAAKGYLLGGYVFRRRFFCWNFFDKTHRTHFIVLFPPSFIFTGMLIELVFNKLRQNLLVRNSFLSCHFARFDFNCFDAPHHCLRSRIWFGPTRCCQPLAW